MEAPERRTSILALVALMTMAPAATRAQHVEITPVAGFTLAGSVSDGQGNDIDLNGPSAGVVLDVAIAEQWWLTVLFSRAWSEDTVADAAGARRVTFTLDQYHVGVREELVYGRVRPYGMATLGLTRYAAGTLDADPTNLFGLSLGLGVRFFPVPWVGLRAEGRGMANFADGASALACGGGCVLFIRSDVLWLGEATVGLTFAF
jgi:hypothetical protein